MSADTWQEKYPLDDVKKLIVRLLQPTRIVLSSSNEPVSRKRRYVRNHDILIILLETLPDKMTELDCMGKVYKALPPWPIDVDVLVLTEEKVAKREDFQLTSIMREGITLYESESGRIRLAG